MQTKSSLFKGIILIVSLVLFKELNLYAQKSIRDNFELSSRHGYNISCNGGSDGSITSIVGIHGLNTYLWSTGDTTASITGLTAGDYVVTITGEDSVFVRDTFRLTQPNPLVISLNTPVGPCNYNLSRFGASDGIISSTVTGGVSSYNYQWSNGSNDAIQYNLTADNYTLNITDENGCNATNNIVLTEPDQVTLTNITKSQYGSYNLSCSDGTEGSIEATVTGGSKPYHYMWTGGPENINITDTIGSISNLPAGTYHLYFWACAGGELDTNIVLTAPDPIEVSTNSLVYSNGGNVSCSNCSDGLISGIVTGGTSPYTYEWKDTSETVVGIGDTLSDVIAGVYTLTVTDANNCSIGTVKATLNSPALLWSLNGNVGTSPSNQFLGTIDSTDFSFKANNVERLRIKADGRIDFNGSLKVDTPSTDSARVVFVDQNGILKTVGTGGGTVGPMQLPWMIGGNPNINDQVNFIGTTTASDFIIKTYDPSVLNDNLKERIRITKFGDIKIKSFENTTGGLVMTDVNGNLSRYSFNNNQDEYLKSNGTWSGLPAGASLWSINTNKIYPTDISNNIGIGTSNPSEKLEVWGGNLFVRGDDFQGPNDYAALYLGDQNHSQYIKAKWDGGLHFGTSGATDALVIQDNTGNIGIGLNASNVNIPSEKLQINRGNILVKGVDNFLSTQNEATLFLGSTNYSIKSIRDLGIGLSIPNNPNLLFITNSGNLGFGTQNPVQSPFMVSTPYNGSTIFQLQGTIPMLRLFNSTSSFNDDLEILAAQNSGRIISTGNLYMFFDADDNGGTNEAFKIYAKTNDDDGTKEVFRVTSQGRAFAKSFKVTQSFADYVFEDNYKLKSLKEVENYIRLNKHLEGIPTAKEVEQEGLDVGEIAKGQMEKIEEITLYLIAQDKSIESLKKENEEIKNELKILKDKLNNK